MGPIVVCSIDNLNINEIPELNKYPCVPLHGTDDNLLSLKTGKKIKSCRIIDDKIKNRSFFNYKNVINAVNSKETVHLVGTLKKDSFNFLISLIEVCRREKNYNVYIHLFLKKENFQYLDKLNLVLKKAGFGVVSTIMDEMYIENDLNTFCLYDTLINKNGNYYNNFDELLKNTTDIIEPSVFDMEGTIKENESIIVFDFNKYLNDFSMLLCNKECEFYIPNIEVSTFQFNKDNSLFTLNEEYITIFEILSKKGLRQLLIDDEKYDMKKCNSILNKGKDFTECIDILLKELNNKKYDFVFINSYYSNNSNIKNLINYLNSNVGLLLLISNNCDQTCLTVISNNYSINSGNIYDISPTILKILGISIPNEMDGHSLVNIEREVTVIKTRKKHNKFVIISLVLFLILTVIYAFRFFYYKNNEDKLYSIVEGINI